MSTDKEFKKELAALGDKISASRIESLTKKAIKLTLKQSDFVLETIAQYIQKARKEARLGAMYLIDSLAKSSLKLSEKDENFKNLYYKKLPERLGEVIPLLFDCEAKEREKIKKIITIWAQQEKMFLPGFAAHMMKKFEAFGRSNPVAAVKQDKPEVPSPVVVKQEVAPVVAPQIPAPSINLPQQISSSIENDMTPLPPPTVGFYNLETLLVEKTNALLENIKLLGGKISIGLAGPFPESVSALLPSSAKQNTNVRSESRHNQSDPRQGHSYQNDPRQSQSQGYQQDPRQSQSQGYQQDPRQSYNDHRQQFGQDQRQFDPRQDPRGGYQNDRSSDPRGYQNDRGSDPRGYQNDRGSDPRGYQNDPRSNQSDPRGYQNDRDSDPRGNQNDRGSDPRGFHDRQQQSDYSRNRPGQDSKPDRNNRNNELPIPPGPNCEPSYIDPSVSPDCIKSIRLTSNIVLSRTVFISGFPPSMQQNQLKEILESVARIQTIRVNSQKQNAFIKVATRKEAETLQYEFQGYQIDQSYLKVGWASGYGPREHFAFNTGITLYPIRQIPAGDISFIENSPRGGGKVLPSAVMEEPDLPLEITLGSKKMENSPPKRMHDDGGSAGPPRQRW